MGQELLGRFPSCLLMSSPKPLALPTQQHPSLPPNPGPCLTHSLGLR